MTAPDVRWWAPPGVPILPLLSAQWYWTPPGGTLTTSGTHGNGTLRYVPVSWPAGTLVNVNADIATAGNASSTVRMGLYYDANGTPGALLTEFGSVAGDTITPTALSGTWTIPYSGVWWWATAVQNAATTQPVLRVVSVGGSSIPVPAAWSGVPGTGGTQTAANCCLTQAIANAALPATAAPTGAGGSVARLLVKTA